MMRPLLAAVALLALAACRSSSPLALGSGQVIFRESPGVHVTVRECVRVATYTVALREAIEAARPEGRLVLVFHDGPSRYLGGGYAEVHCEDWSAIAGLIREHNERTNP